MTTATTPALTLAALQADHVNAEIAHGAAVMAVIHADAGQWLNLDTDDLAAVLPLLAAAHANLLRAMVAAETALLDIEGAIHAAGGGAWLAALASAD